MKKIAISCFMVLLAMVSCNKASNDTFYNTVTVQFQYNGANTLYSISGNDGTVSADLQSNPFV